MGNVKELAKALAVEMKSNDPQPQESTQEPAQEIPQPEKPEPVAEPVKEEAPAQPVEPKEETKEEIKEETQVENTETKPESNVFEEVRSLNEKIDKMSSLFEKHGESVFKHSDDSKRAPEIMKGKSLKEKSLSQDKKQLLDLLMTGKGKFTTTLSGSQSDFDNLHEKRKAKGLFGSKALDSTAGDGLEYIPTTYADELYIRLGEISSILAPVRRFVQKSATQEYPLATVRPVIKYDDAVAASGTEDTVTTAKMTLTAKKMIGQSLVYDDTDKDTIIDLMPLSTQMLVEALNNAIVRAVISGDTTATHQDSDINAISGDPAKAWKGLRKYALAGSLTSDWSTGNVSFPNIVKLFDLMGKYAMGTEAANCRLVAGVKGWYDILGLDEFKRYDIVGTAPSGLRTGEPGIMWRCPIISDTQMRENLNASGVYDGVTTDNGSMILFNAANFLLSTWKEMEIEVDRVAPSHNIIYVKWRGDFQPFEAPSTTVPTVAMGYNFAT